MVDSDGGVTILKQGLGSLVYDVSKVFGWLRFKTHEWKWRWRVFAQNCQVWAVLCSKVLGRFFCVLEIVCFDENNLCISKEKVRVLERVRSTRYRLIAMLLDFEVQSQK